MTVHREIARKRLPGEGEDVLRSVDLRISDINRINRFRNCLTTIFRTPEQPISECSRSIQKDAGSPTNAG